MPLPWLRPPAQLARAGAQRPFRVLCLWGLGLYGHGAGAVARGAAAPGGLPEASSPPAAHATPSASRHLHEPGRQRQPPGSAPPIHPSPRAPVPGRPDLAQQLAAFQAALPGSRGDTYLQQRGIPLALAQQLGVGYAAPGTWPHAARDWRGGRVVFPHTTPDGCLVNLYGRAVGTAEQVPKAKRHDHLPGAKGYFNAAALQAGAGPLWVCEGAFDALALLAAGVSRVVAIFGVQGWRWDWAREVRALVFALDADAAGQQQWRQLARQAALRGKQVAVLEPAAYGGHKDVNEAWVAGTLAVDAWLTPAAEPGARLAVPEDLHEAWAERVAIMLADGHLLPEDAARLAWEGLQGGPPSSMAAHAGHDGTHV